jgi:beta-lactamase class A
MNWLKQGCILLLSCALLTGVGCGKKKASLPMPSSEAKPAAQPVVKAAPVRHFTAVKQAVQDGAPCYLYFSDLKTGTVFTRQDHPVSSASMIKVFILAKAYEDINQGKLSRGETFTLGPDNVVGGSGILQGLPYGTTVSLNKVLETMITESDNTATNIMIDCLGMDAINRYMQEHGYSHSVLRRKMMDLEALRQGRDNITTPGDVGTLFTRIYHGKCVNPELDKEMLAIYKKQKDHDILPAMLPKGTVVAHKTGEVNDVRHDGGIVYSPKGDYVLCIFSENYLSYNTMASLSRKIYDAYQNGD